MRRYSDSLPRNSATASTRAHVGWLIIRQRVIHLFRKLPLPIILAIILESFWMLFDRAVTSQIYYKPPRPYITPTESSPLSPYYTFPKYYDAYGGPTRIFQKKTFPCTKLWTKYKFDNPGTLWKKAFLYVKSSYAAGTTLSGVSTRIARNVARRTRPEDIDLSSNQTACATWNAPIRAKRLKNRDLANSFLWSMVREPVDRLVSRFFHEVVSRDGNRNPPPTRLFESFVEDAAPLEYANALKTLSMRTLRRTIVPDRKDLFQTYVHEILDAYDFLGIVERFDESLAVLQLILGLETEDMLYLTSRKSPTSNMDEHNSLLSPPIPMKDITTGATSCVRLQPKEVTLAMKKFLYRPYLYEEVFEADVYLYKAINASLDATIQQLGHDYVANTVRRLQWAQQQVSDRCIATETSTDHPNFRFPCTHDGVLQSTNDCILSDVGCGYKCIDTVAESLRKDPKFLQIEL